MGRDSLTNQLAIKRKTGFLKTFNKRIDTLKREKARLERSLDDPDSLKDQPWIENVERTVQGFIGAGPVYGITPVSAWAKRSLEHINKIRQNGNVPTANDIDWITSVTQELTVLYSEAMTEIQNELTPEVLADSTNRITSLPLGAFPSARRSSLGSLEPETKETPGESATNATGEIEAPMDQGTLPHDPVVAASSETEDRSAAVREPTIPLHTVSVGGYGPPWETFPSKSVAPEPGANEPVDVEATHVRNAENTIPLTIEDLTALSDNRDREKPPAPLAREVEPAGKAPLGWMLLTGSLFVALLISLYFNWRSYASDADRPISNEAPVGDTGEMKAAPTADTQADAVGGDNRMRSDGKGSTLANVKVSIDKDKPSASEDKPKKTTKRKSRSRSRSRAESKSKRKQAKTSVKKRSSQKANRRSSKASDPRPSRTTGVLSILLPSHARGSVSITVNKRPKGNAPLKLALTPGVHEVVQTYRGKRTKRIVRIKQGRTKVISAKVPK